MLLKSTSAKKRWDTYRIKNYQSYKSSSNSCSLLAFSIMPGLEEGIQPFLQQSILHLRQTQQVINNKRKRFYIYDTYADRLGKELFLLNI